MNRTRLMLVSVVGLGIALIGIGAYYLIDYYLFLQNCYGLPCPNFDPTRDFGRFILTIGVVIFAVGILASLRIWPRHAQPTRVQNRNGS